MRRSRSCAQPPARGGSVGIPPAWHLVAGRSAGRDKGGFAYWWRSHLSPVPNHRIREPVRFWSQEGPDEAVLQALADRRLGDLARLAPSPQAEREQLAEELAT